MSGYFPSVPLKARPNAGHQTKTGPILPVASSFEAAVATTATDTTLDDGGTWEWPFNSLSTWADELPIKTSEWPVKSLASRGIAEALGTFIQVWMISLVFQFTYNSSAPAIGGLLSGRFSDFTLIVLATTLTATATHAGFWNESAKFNPFISFWSIFVAQSHVYGWGFDFLRAFVEIVAQLAGGILGALLVWAIEPTVAVRTYITSGYPFFDNDLTSRGQALGIQIIAMTLISYTFARIQYGLSSKTGLQSHSLLVGFAYGGAAIVSYATGSCTTFARWFGAAVVTGVFNMQTAASMTADSTADNVISPLWVYLVGDIIGTFVGIIFFYIVLYRPQVGTTVGTTGYKSM
jgi:glycerol uptake facilitator-like aquaporin